MFVQIKTLTMCYEYVACLLTPAGASAELKICSFSLTVV